MSQRQYSLKGARALFGAAFLYALTAVLVREMSPMWGDRAQVAARYVLVFVLLAAYTYFRKTKAKVPQNKLHLAVGLGVFFALVVLFFTLSIQKTTIANSLFTFYATGMITCFLFGTLLLKESVSTTKILAIVLALTGLSLYSKAVISGNEGIILAMAAGVCSGFSSVCSNRLKGVNRVAVLRVQYGVGSVLTVLVTLLSGEKIIRHASPRGVLIVCIFALVLLAAANLLLYGLQRFDVNISAVLTSTELVFGALFGFLFFQEVPAAHELLGGALIFAASAIGSFDIDRLLLRKALQP